ncbi:efflux RND transporter periplasmic adaptor subunit [Desulfosporosinus meridiei]|uniref:RND family efflux transporter, MFP subunit n=1 Tax=Desulfosporosinus meridiei (strain ATCC BAA-275 / DSM 13257 / KCTC 12902 / NCIMB 13706 / S10) TaxID=768704 RepID=J7IXM1_DESMD|nr:efflux RND transporter periplasmic adaptor subunit [Desulfosporosinus meridiei]AFQ44889.1 RND family efflux transporter, MFP subunit [Desulfosporosinus meridiei DSM 13257]
MKKISFANWGFKITKKKVLTIVVVLILAGTGVRSFMGKTENTLAETAPNIVYVKATVAENVNEQAIISYKASLEASEEGIVSGKVSGKVVQVMFENGQYVTQGDPLIKLDDQEIRNNIASSQAQLKASESQLVSSQTGLQKMQLNVENAVRTYDRTKELFDGGAISKVELESAETAVNNAKIDLETEKANIETAKANLTTAQIDVNNLADSLANTIITAPITGILDEKSVSLGQYANMGVVLAKVKAISPIYAVIEVDQNDISSLQVGQSAKVTVGSNVVKDYDGIIKSIEASADTTSRVFKCKVEVTNLDQALKPGIYAKVDIVSDQTSEVIAVPTDALSGNPGNYTVFVIDQGVARKRIVSIGQISKGLVEIKDGVKNGDSVIITNVNTLQDGDAVSVVKE